MFAARKLKTLLLVSNMVRTSNRNLMTTPVKLRSLAEFKKLQADFQAEDGRPVFLKGGLCDRILYSATIILTFVGLFDSAKTLYDQAKPNTWKQPR